MIKMAVLGSGSKGNSILIEHADTRILIDAGLSAKQLVLRLKTLGVDADEIDAILITHEHIDHVGGIDVFLRKRSIPVFSNAFTRETIAHKMTSDINWKIFSSEQTFKVGELTVTPFKIQHNAADPVAFVLSGQGCQLGVVTDVGYVTGSMREMLRGCHAIYIEANYDESLLEKNTTRPYSVKQRIASRHGHLSNVQTAELLHEVACEKLNVIALGHLSSDCNSPEIAVGAVRKALDLRGFKNVAIHCSQQDKSTSWLQCKESLDD